MKFAQVLRKFLPTEHLHWLLQADLGFPPDTLIKETLRQRCFSVNFGKSLKTSLDRATADDCFLCLSVNFEEFSRVPIIEYLGETIYFMFKLKSLNHQIH